MRRNDLCNVVLTLLAAAMSVALAGCFISEQPKFPLSTATAAFGEGGRYDVLDRAAAGKYEHQEFFTVKHNADGSYVFVNEKNDTLPISFHPLSEGLLIGQAKPEKDKAGYGYVLLRVTPAEMLVYAPQCDSQDKDKLKAFNVTFDGQYKCVIDGVNDLKGLFAAVDLGEPISKMIRQ